MNTWLWNVAYADPGLLREMLVEWPRDESHGTKKWSAGMYQAAMVHPPNIILMLIETQTIFYHVELRNQPSFYAPSETHEERQYFGSIW